MNLLGSKGNGNVNQEANLSAIQEKNEQVSIGKGNMETQTKGLF